MVELIVVMAIIAALAAILVPVLMHYANDARIARLNANARHVYGAASYAIADSIAISGAGVITPNTVYTGDSSDLIGYSPGGVNINMTKYLGDDFIGSFAFVTDSSGSGCTYALWKEGNISASDVAQLTQQDVENKYIGCFPLKIDDDP